MDHNRLTQLMSGLCLALMLGLLWLGDATLGAFVLVALGAGLMTTACVLAELWSPSGRAP